MSATRIRLTPRGDGNVECTQPGSKKRFQSLAGRKNFLKQSFLRRGNGRIGGDISIHQTLDRPGRALNRGKIGNSDRSPKLRDGVTQSE